MKKSKKTKKVTVAKKVVTQAKKKKRRPRGYWCEATVIKELQNRKEVGLDINAPQGINDAT